MREDYENMPLNTLRDIAKKRGMRGISALRKTLLIERLAQMDEEAASAEPIAEEKTLVLNETVSGPKNLTANEAVKEERTQVSPLRSNQGQEKGEALPSRGYQGQEQGETLPPRGYQGQERGETLSSRGYQGQEKAEPLQPRSNQGQESSQPRSFQSQERSDSQQGRIPQQDGRIPSGQGMYRTPVRNYRPQGRPVGQRTDGFSNRVYRQTREENAGGADMGQRNIGRDLAENYSSAASSYSSDTVPVQSMTLSGYSNDRNNSDLPAENLAELDSGQMANGILEVMPDGFGFIRSSNYLPGDNDIYVAPSQIRRFNLRTGDIVQGNIRIKTQGEKFSALLYVTSLNGFPPSEGQNRYLFENMTPVFPNERLIMERPNGTNAMRVLDLISPIGKGQRGMIVSPPKAGKTTLLKDVAKSITRNNPEMKLIILLIDERPEEVTDIKEAIHGPNVEVIYSTFDETPEHHRRVSEMVIERARRLVEHRQDVIILLDSITRLARAYNLVVPPSGRTLSGGLDPAALHMPKRFFGAARNMREGGSLTILATALVDTGSKMDDVIYEEFKGTGNMELVLDRKLQEKRVFPAIDIQKSSTRREDLLLRKDELEAVDIMRKALNGMKKEDAVEQILNMFARTRSNAEFVQLLKRQKLS